MENNRNYFLAIGLSVLILVVWQVFYVTPKLEEEQAQRALVAEQQAAQAQATSQNGDNIPSVSNGQAAGSAPNASLPLGTKIPLEQAISANDRVIIDTPALKGSINLKGARLDDLVLLEYRETLDEGSPNVRLLAPANATGGYFTEVGYVADQSVGPVPGADTIWSVKSGDTLGVNKSVTLTYDNGQGLIFDRKISLDDHFLFIVEDTITNESGENVALSSYGRITRMEKPQTSGIYILHEGLIGYLGEELGLQEIDYGDLEDDGVLTLDKTSSGWTGITDKYWATALVPQQGNSFQTRYGYYDNGAPRFQTDFLSDALQLAAGTSGTVQTDIFAGAKVSPLIQSYADDYEIPRFDLMIDWGWFYFLTKPMFTAIDFFSKYTGNFGIGILLTTVLVKLVFFPLANKSYKSMANMKKVQPKMEELKKKHGDDRQELQKAMMQLYKDEKINPVAGCWPVLLQIPVFFALYKVIYVTIEMRHAPFFGWIQDLSAQDPTSIFNLFGLLPYDLPSFLLIGVWPIIMGITMFLQMRMNPTPADPTQAMIFTWMPIIFTFMLATFPAGLVIYWAWNNFLSILQQGVIMKRQGVPIELWGNLKDLFKKKPKAEADK